MLSIKIKIVILLTTVSIFVLPSLADNEDPLGPNDKACRKAEQFFEKGHHALDKHNARDAEAYYRKAVELNPNESRYHRQLTILLLTEGRGHEAEREALYATKSDPKDWRSFLVLGQVYHTQDRIDEEVTVYKKVLAMLPADQKDVHDKIVAFIKKDEESVKEHKERLRKKKEFEERQYKNAY